MLNFISEHCRCGGRWVTAHYERHPTRKHFGDSRDEVVVQQCDKCRKDRKLVTTINGARQYVQRR